MLSTFSESTRNLLQSAAQHRKLAKGEMLFHEGKQPLAVYILLNGKMKLYTIDNNGREQIVHLAAPNDIMGYRAVLGGDTFSVSATALEPSEVLVVPKETFLQALEADPEFSHAVIRLLTQELRHAEHHLAGLARMHVRARLAQVLLILGNKFGYEADNQTLAVSMSRDEIAGLVGTATETVIRLLNTLKEEGLVATSGRKLRLIDKSGLQRCSEGL